jgi:hypothetical protein
MSNIAVPLTRAPPLAAAVILQLTKTAALTRRAGASDASRR